MRIQILWLSSSIWFTGCGDKSGLLETSSPIPNAAAAVIDNPVSPSLSSNTPPSILKPDPMLQTPIGNRGLRNLGNTCYFNALIQVLAHSDPLVRRLKTLDISPGFAEYTRAFKNLILEIWDEKKGLQAINPKSFLDMCRTNSPQTFIAGQQQDSHEAYVEILNAIAIQDYGFQLLVTYEWDSILRCNSPVAESRRREQYTDWQIIIPESVEAVKLEDLMKGWGNREKADWNCGITGDPNNESATQEYYLASAPETLVVMLKRFSMESKSRARKHMTPVTFSTEIDLGVIFAGRLVPALVSGGPGSLKYNLVGVVNHHGSAPNSGHYNADYYNTHYKQWFHANDASCSKIDVPGTRPSSLPYMFIYTKAQ